MEGAVMICQGTGRHRSHCQGCVRARAAPRLLAALKRTLLVVEMYGNLSDLEAIRAAIAEAEEA